MSGRHPVSPPCQIFHFCQSRHPYNRHFPPLFLGCLSSNLAAPHCTLVQGDIAAMEAVATQGEGGAAAMRANRRCTTPWPPLDGQGWTVIFCQRIWRVVGGTVHPADTGELLVLPTSDFLWRSWMELLGCSKGLLQLSPSTVHLALVDAMPPSLGSRANKQLKISKPATTWCSSKPAGIERIFASFFNFHVYCRLLLDLAVSAMYYRHFT